MIRSIPIVAAVLGSFISASHAETLNPPNEIPSCPALNKNNERLKIEPSIKPVDFDWNLNFEDSSFIRAATLATEIVAFLETGKIKDRARYKAISTVDQLSVGQLQWHWSQGQGTLVTEFFADMPEELVVDIEDPTLRRHLTAIWIFSNSAGSFEAATDAIAYLASFSGADHLSSDFANWLASSKIVGRQNSLKAARLKKGLVLTKAWMRDRDYPADQFETTFVLLNNFNTHGGLEPRTSGLRDVWSEQLDAFKAAFDGRQEMFEYILTWIESCREPASRGKYDGVWNGSNTFHPTQGNLVLWSDPAFISSLSETRVDLFAYAFLYATRSKSDGEGDYIPGFIQLGVLNRGGTLALGKGRLNGASFDIDDFR